LINPASIDEQELFFIFRKWWGSLEGAP